MIKHERALKAIIGMRVIGSKKPITLAAAIKLIEKMQTLALDALTSVR